jgi:RNA polymerase sigma-70 factor (ECF subfamily)
LSDFPFESHKDDNKFQMVVNYSQRSDRDLILSCQRREPAAFEELVKRHQKPVYSLLYQLAPDWPDIADLSQEVFIRVWRSISNLRNPVSFRSWLTKQVLSLFYEELKTRPQDISKRTLSIIDGDIDPAQNEAVDPEDELEIDENLLSDDPAALIAEAMKRLPEPLRTPVVLRELEGLNYEEIALLTKTEVGTVQLRIARARTKLQNMLGRRLKSLAGSTEGQS